DLRAALVAAAEAGDFSEYTTPQAIRASLIIQGSDAPVPDAGLVAPLARQLNGGAGVDEARAYQLVLPQVERILTPTDEYESLWRAAWTEIERALESFARGSSRVAEDERAHLSVVMLAPELYGAHGFKPTRHAAPYTAIARHARGQIFLIAIPMQDGFAYRLDYPYYSWADTVVRPRIARRDLTPLIARLNELERDQQTRWRADTSELTSAIKSFGADGLLRASRLAPDEVATELRLALREQTVAHVS